MPANLDRRKNVSRRAGWDACTGLGSIHGDGLLRQLRASAHALAATS